jgi:glycosyltransferase involved in cell wall biosynthesis
MQNSQYHFTGVSLLVTHYNRSRSLERLLKSFRELNCYFDEIIVSDDGSRDEHLSYIRLLGNQYTFTLVTTPVNKGLGNNINKGQDSVRSPLTLYVQEDFDPTENFPAHFARSLELMHTDKGLDIIRFYAYFRYPYTKPYTQGFSELQFKWAPWYTNHLKFHFYSDHPHLRRSDFFTKFGRYREGISGDKTEYCMSLSFIKNHARGLFSDDFNGLFDQKNSADEPSTMGRANWRQEQKPLVLLIRYIYLQFKFVKCTLDLMFYPRK